MKAAEIVRRLKAVVRSLAKRQQKGRERAYAGIVAAYNGDYCLSSYVFPSRFRGDKSRYCRLAGTRIAVCKGRCRFGKAMLDHGNP